MNICLNCKFAESNCNKNKIFVFITLLHYIRGYERQAKIDKDVASEENTKREKCNDFEINLENCEFLSSA